MASLGALGQIAGMLKISGGEGAPKDDAPNGEKVLYLFHSIARHIMDHFATMSMEPLILLNVTCEHLELGLMPRLGDIPTHAESAEEQMASENAEPTLAALGATSLQANLHATAKVCFRLGHPDEEVRQKTRDAISDILREDKRIETESYACDLDETTTVVAKMIAQLQDGSTQKKCHALGRLQELAVRGQPGVLEAVKPCLDHEDIGVRCEAIKAYGQVAKKGDQTATAAILQQAKDRDHFVRAAALEALGPIVQFGDLETCLALAAFLEDRSTVRRIAARLLGELAEPGEARLVARLQELLQHDQGMARCAALRLLGRLADPSDERSTELMEECLDSDEEEEVQEVAEKALDDLEERGKEREKDRLAMAGAIRSACAAAITGS